MKELVLIAKERKGDKERYLNLKNHQIISKNSVKILNKFPSTMIIYHKERPIIKMNHGLFPKANALLLQKRINGNKVNSIYAVNYCKIKEKFIKK